MSILSYHITSHSQRMAPLQESMLLCSMHMHKPNISTLRCITSLRLHAWCFSRESNWDYWPSHLIPPCSTPALYPSLCDVLNALYMGMWPRHRPSFRQSALGFSQHTRNTWRHSIAPTNTHMHKHLVYKLHKANEPCTSPTRRIHMSMPFFFVILNKSHCWGETVETFFCFCVCSGLAVAVAVAHRHCHACMHACNIIMHWVCLSCDNFTHKIMCTARLCHHPLLSYRECNISKILSISSNNIKHDDDTTPERPSLTQSPQ